MVHKNNWQQLYKLGYKKICHHFSLHNQGFPLDQYSRAYPHRLKDSEMKTALNAFRQWCKQAASQLNSGQGFITNILRTNNRKLRENQDGSYASKSSTPGHLAKLSYCQFFLGKEETDETPHDQLVYLHRDRGGKGFGWKPYKRFRGRKNDYELILNPQLLPVELIAHITFIPQKGDFGAKILNLKSSSPSPPLHQKLVPSYSSHSVNRNKDISPKASAKADHLQEEGNIFSKESASADNPSEERNPEEGSPSKVGQHSGERQKIAGRIFDLTEKRIDLQAAFQLVQGGERLLYYAQILVNMYRSKLAPAMGRIYVERQYEGGLENILQMLGGIPEESLDSFHDRLVQTIDHQEKRLKRYPEAYIAGPARFFQATYAYNILHYEKNWLSVYEKRAVEFEEMALAKGRKAQIQLQEEAEIAQQDKKWYFLAWRFKSALMGIHRRDMRLRKANLANWERDIRLMVRKDGILASELIAVMHWLLESPLPQAKFWRKEAGIKSTSGLRKHYQAIHQAFEQEKEIKDENPIPPSMQKNQPKQIPPRRSVPKQIPSVGKHKP